MGKLVTLATRTVDLSTIFSTFLSHPEMKYKKFLSNFSLSLVGGRMKNGWGRDTIIIM
jgi:hypothetical protein